MVDKKTKLTLCFFDPHLFFPIGVSHLQTLRDTERVRWWRAYARRHQGWSYTRPSTLVGGACRRGVATGGVATGRLVTEGSSGALRAGVFEVLRAGDTARVQAAARGCRQLRVVEWVSEDITGRVAREVQALHGDAKAQIRVGDELMRLLLRIDAVRGARDYRRRVARRVLKLQDDVNALEQSPVVEEVEAEAADLSGSEENNSRWKTNWRRRWPQRWRWTGTEP
jgi:hypothetical protein